MLIDDPADQLLARASGFLEAARIVVKNAGNKSVLRAPVAHLIAHGLEVLMKHVLVAKGKTLDEVKKIYGHNLYNIWSSDDMESFREITLKHARLAWTAAKESGKYEDDFCKDPEEDIVEYIREYSRLHSRETKFALRYVADPDVKVPIPLFLLDTFQPVKDELARVYSRRRPRKNV